MTSFGCDCFCRRRRCSRTSLASTMTLSMTSTSGQLECWKRLPKDQDSSSERSSKISSRELETEIDSGSKTTNKTSKTQDDNYADDWGGGGHTSLARKAKCTAQGRGGPPSPMGTALNSAMVVAPPVASGVAVIALEHFLILLTLNVKALSSPLLVY